MGSIQWFGKIPYKCFSSVFAESRWRVAELVLAWERGFEFEKDRWCMRQKSTHQTDRSWDHDNDLLNVSSQSVTPVLTGTRQIGGAVERMARTQH